MMSYLPVNSLLTFTFLTWKCVSCQEWWQKQIVVDHNTKIQFSLYTFCVVFMKNSDAMCWKILLIQLVYKEIDFPHHSLWQQICEYIDKTATTCISFIPTKITKITSFPIVISILLTRNFPVSPCVLPLSLVLYLTQEWTFYVWCWEKKFTYMTFKLNVSLRLICFSKTASAGVLLFKHFLFQRFLLMFQNMSYMLHHPRKHPQAELGPAIKTVIAAYYDLL